MKPIKTTFLLILITIKGIVAFSQPQREPRIGTSTPLPTTTTTSPCTTSARPASQPIMAPASNYSQNWTLKNGTNYFCRLIYLDELAPGTQNSQKTFEDTFTDDGGDSFTSVTGSVNCVVAQ